MTGLALLLLAQQPATFGTGEAALTATSLLALLFLVVGFFVRERLSALKKAEAEIAHLQRELVGKDKLEGHLDRIENRIVLLEREIAVAGASRLVDRVQKLESDMNEIKGGVRSTLEKVEATREKIDMILDWVRSQSGEHPLGHYHSRKTDPPKGGEERRKT